MGLVPPLKMVRDYVKEWSENRKVNTRLKSVLQSLTDFDKASKAFMRDGNALYDKFMAVPVAMSLQDAEGIVRMMTQFCSGYSDVLETVVSFGRECNFLTSGEVEGFMETVKRIKPDVHDVITTFGKGYRPKTDTLDLTSVPMLLRIVYPKVGQKANRELSKGIEEGKQKIGKALEKARIMRKQRLPFVRSREINIEYSRSLAKLVKNGRKVMARQSAVSELSKSGPPWMNELMEVMDQIQKSISTSTAQTRPIDRVPGWRTCISKTAHKKN